MMTSSHYRNTSGVAKLRTGRCHPQRCCWPVLFWFKECVHEILNPLSKNWGYEFCLRCLCIAALFSITSSAFSVVKDPNKWQFNRALAGATVVHLTILLKHPAILRGLIHCAEPRRFLCLWGRGEDAF